MLWSELSQQAQYSASLREFEETKFDAILPDLYYGDGYEGNTTQKREESFAEIEQKAEEIILPQRGNNNDDGVGGGYMDKDNAAKSSKPHFVFHIGIPKSGTTSIQCSLTELTGELEFRDSYHYIGKACPNAGFRLSNGNEAIKGHFWYPELNKGEIGMVGRSLNDRLAQYLHRQDGRNTTGVLFSVEVFSQSRKFKGKQQGFDVMKSILNGYSVRIVVAYRRYFEWMPSLFQQENYRKPLKRSMLKYIRDRLNNRTVHPTTEAKLRWSAHFDDVYVFNMHQKGDLVTNFICQSLPGEPTNLCRKRKASELMAANATASHNDTFELARTRKPETKVFNSFRDMDFLRLKAAMQELGWGPRSGSHENKIKRKFQRFQIDRPGLFRSMLSCLTVEEEEKFLNLSLALEEQFVATASTGINNNNDEWFQELLLPSNLEDHRKKFHEYARKGKYCEFEAVRALSNKNSSFVRYLFPEFATKP